MIIIGKGIGSPMVSSVIPRAELNVSVSRDAANTSAKRLNAQNPYFSLWYTGASSRSRRHVS